LTSAAASAPRSSPSASQIRSASDLPSETTVTAGDGFEVYRLTNSANAFAWRDGKTSGIAVVVALLAGTFPELPPFKPLRGIVVFASLTGTLRKLQTPRHPPVTGTRVPCVLIRSLSQAG
jgi:hypothetical protein